MAEPFNGSTPGTNGAHSIMAYGYNRGSLTLYDPNFHANNGLTMIYDTTEKTFAGLTVSLHMFR